MKIEERVILNETCTAHLETQKNIFPNRKLIFFEDQSIDVSQLLYFIDKTAMELRRQGIRKGDRVALMLPNIPMFVVAYYAIFRIGGVVVPINILYGKEELEHIFRLTNVKGVIHWYYFSTVVNQALQSFGDSVLKIAIKETSLSSAMKDFSDFDPARLSTGDESHADMDDPAVIQFSSGTTGTMRGSVWSHRNVSFMAQVCGEVFTISESDCFLGALPLFHPIGQVIIVNTALWHGASIALQQRFDPAEIVKALTDRHISIMVGVPAMYQILLRTLGDTVQRYPRLRLCVSSGGYLPPEKVMHLEEQLLVPVLEGYGTTECLALACCNYIQGPRKHGSVGYPLPEVEMRIVNEAGQTLSATEVGEIAVRGENVVLNSLNTPDTCNCRIKDKWLYTGDLGYMDDEGFFYFLDRKEDVIVKGGFHVYPKEVEEALLEHDRVIEAAVIGIPDKLRGEEVKACIVPKEENAVTSEELILYCRKRLPLYKCPKEIVFYKELPRGSTGKVLKKNLRIERENVDAQSSKSAPEKAETVNKPDENIPAPDNGTREKEHETPGIVS